jgi:hypothetical protein
MNTGGTPFSIHRLAQSGFVWVNVPEAARALAQSESENQPVQVTCFSSAAATEGAATAKSGDRGRDYRPNTDVNRGTNTSPCGALRFIRNGVTTPVFKSTFASSLRLTMFTKSDGVCRSDTSTFSTRLLP